MKCSVCQNEMIKSQKGWLCLHCGHIEADVASPHDVPITPAEAAQPAAPAAVGTDMTISHLGSKTNPSNDDAPSSEPTEIKHELTITPPSEAPALTPPTIDIPAEPEAQPDASTAVDVSMPDSKDVIASIQLPAEPDTSEAAIELGDPEETTLAVDPAPVTPSPAEDDASGSDDVNAEPMIQTPENVTAASEELIITPPPSEESPEIPTATPQVSETSEIPELPDIPVIPEVPEPSAPTTDQAPMPPAPQSAPEPTPPAAPAVISPLSTPKTPPVSNVTSSVVSAPIIKAIDGLAPKAKPAATVPMPTAPIAPAAPVVAAQIAKPLQPETHPSEMSPMVVAAVIGVSILTLGGLGTAGYFFIIK